MRKRNAGIVAAASIGLLIATLGPALAGESSVEVLHGQRRATTTWHNPTGRQGAVEVRTVWDRESRKAIEKEAAEAAKAAEEAAAKAEAEAAAGDEAAVAQEGDASAAAPEAGKKSGGHAPDFERAAGQETTSD